MIGTEAALADLGPLPPTLLIGWHTRSRPVRVRPRLGLSSSTSTSQSPVWITGPSSHVHRSWLQAVPATRLYDLPNQPTGLSSPSATT
jgi:hypothetical protein